MILCNMEWHTKPHRVKLLAYPTSLYHSSPFLHMLCGSGTHTLIQNTDTHTLIHTHKHTHIHTYTLIHIDTNIQIYTYIYIIHLLSYTHTLTLTHTHTHTHTLTLTHTHTHTHTHLHHTRRSVSFYASLSLVEIPLKYWNACI